MAARVKLVLFGVGRIGTYHFKSMLVSEQASISHVIEIDTTRADAVVRKYHMEETVKVMHMDKMAEVLSDPK